MDLIPPNHRRCRRCTKVKPRQLFKPKKSGSFNYDYLCNDCRNKKKYVDPYTLTRRVVAGLTTPEQEERYRKRVQENYKVRVQRAKENRCRASWEAPFRSAQFAYRRVVGFAAPSYCLPWKLAMIDLLRRVLKEIKLRRKTELLTASSDLIFWFDVFDWARKEFHEIMKQYPEGERECPLIVL